MFMWEWEYIYHFHRLLDIDISLDVLRMMPTDAKSGCQELVSKLKASDLDFFESSIASLTFWGSERRFEVR